MIQWLRTCLVMQGMWVQSLLGRLRSQRLWNSSARALQLMKHMRSGARATTRVCATQWEILQNATEILHAVTKT